MPAMQQSRSGDIHGETDFDRAQVSYLNQINQPANIPGLLESHQRM